jgi:hypothetical protein
MPEPRPVPDLTPDQLSVMNDMFGAGMSIRQACKKHNVSHDTIWRWQQEEGWKAEWSARLADQNEQFYRLLGTATGLAAKTYIDCMKDPKAKWVDKLHAADSVSRFSGFEPAKKVEHSGKIETTDAVAMAAEIAALEERERELLSKIAGDGG